MASWNFCSPTSHLCPHKTHPLRSQVGSHHSPSWFHDNAAMWLPTCPRVSPRVSQYISSPRASPHASTLLTHFLFPLSESIKAEKSGAAHWGLRFQGLHFLCNHPDSDSAILTQHKIKMVVSCFPFLPTPQLFPAYSMSLHRRRFSG